eukprot:TRINITY_DN7463_c0_g1_i1.p1 TRINITY_DN7463_c0_g1~~TRINITY_DN7463_c0_g1_i1.p1  ORF type:complete len:471 (-),score=69.38 TRINITY_DN7463_c0_g1_i1:63-1439(-)
MDKRELVISEILQTENNYVTKLETLIKDIIAPLQKKTNDEGFLNLEEMDTMFGSIDAILKVHTLLLKDLEDRAENSLSNALYGQVFANIIPYFGMYCDYCATYPDVQSLSTMLVNERKPLRGFLNRVAKRCEDRYCLQDYLILPVQRITRYNLLLQDLDKNTPFDHQDKPFLEKALNLIEKAANSVNDHITKIQNMETALDIATKLYGYPSHFPGLLDPKRFFISKHDMIMYGKKTTEDVIGFVFSDMFLLAYNRNEKYQWITNFTLHDAFMRRCFHEVPPNTFQFVHMKITVMLQLQNETDKELFKKNVRGCVSKLISQNPVFNDQRNRIKLKKNLDNNQWEAYQLFGSSRRISLKQYELETAKETREALQNLLNLNRDRFAKYDQPKSKKRKLEESFSKLSPKKKRRTRRARPKTGTFVTMIENEIQKWENVQNSPVISKENHRSLLIDSRPKFQL